MNPTHPLDKSHTYMMYLINFFMSIWIRYIVLQLLIHILFNYLPFSIDAIIALPNMASRNDFENVIHVCISEFYDSVNSVFHYIWNIRCWCNFSPNLNHLSDRTRFFRYHVCNFLSRKSVTDCNYTHVFYDIFCPMMISDHIVLTTWRTSK